MGYTMQVKSSQSKGSYGLTLTRLSPRFQIQFRTARVDVALRVLASVVHTSLHSPHSRAGRRLWARVRNPLDDCGLMVQHVCMVPHHIGTCRISVDTHANSPTRQIPSCTCSVRAHPARVMHAACDGSGWVPTSPRLSRPARGSPHSHAPHHGSRPRRTRGRDAPAVLPPPPRRQAPSLTHCQRPQGRTWQWESASHACTEM